jgi:hypothetical protein
VARKKKKKSHHSSQNPTPGGSRPMSPDGMPSRPRGAGSDTEGGAMSDRSRVKIKIKRPGSPSSPNSQPGSRAGSPGPPLSRSLDTGPLPTADELRSRIPPEGMPTKDFLQIYKTPTNPERKAQWSAFMKSFLRVKDGRITIRHSATQPAASQETSIKTEDAPPAAG